MSSENLDISQPNSPKGHTQIRTDRLERAIAALDEAMTELRGTAPKKPVLLLVKDEKGDRSISMPKPLASEENAPTQAAAKPATSHNAFAAAATALEDIQKRLSALEENMAQPQKLADEDIEALTDQLSDRVFEKFARA